MCRWLMFYAVGDSWLRIMNDIGYAVIGDLPGIGGQVGLGGLWNRMLYSVVLNIPLSQLPLAQ